ncbi:anti-sigma factor domain-containing protein [Kribbella sp. NPDC049174]|uniref:anti-sigma factor n=1 Tax=Kribbella sp. NPDC049174 TaxID=3364112 RepID=UPI0037124BA1
MTETDVHTLTGPYVLDALPDDERARFEQHLTVCAFCTTEVAELREAAVKLATQVAAPPPPALKTDVMSAIGHIRQQPPLVPGGKDELARRRFSRRSVLALAAAALAVAGTGGVAIDQYRGKQEAVQANDRMAAVLAQPDARTVHGPVKGGGQATVVTSAGADAAVVVLRDLPELPADRTWQLWMIDPNRTAHSVGLASGDLTTVVDGSVTGSVAFGLTVEPEGGSPAPTLPAAAIIPMA